MCITAGHLKMSPRRARAMIVTANMAEGSSTPFGFNIHSERSIAQIQLFTAFVLRHSTMKLAEKSYALTLFADAESARKEKVLMTGFFCVVDGYAVPLPINFCKGGCRNGWKVYFCCTEAWDNGRQLY